MRRSSSSSPAARPLPFGHVGDGNIHYNVTQPVGADKAAFLARWDEVNKAVFAIVMKYGGSISAEHGIGVMKRDILPDVQGPGGDRADARRSRRCSTRTASSTPARCSSGGRQDG